jgi:hypothetical protein
MLQGDAVPHAIDRDVYLVLNEFDGAFGGPGPKLTWPTPTALQHSVQLSTDSKLAILIVAGRLFPTRLFCRRRFALHLPLSVLR